MTEDRTEEFANAAEGAARTLARKHLFLATLEMHGNDRLDFHEVSVEAVRQALIAAFLAGVEYVQTVRAEGGK